MVFRTKIALEMPRGEATVGKLVCVSGQHRVRKKDYSTFLLIDAPRRPPKCCHVELVNWKVRLFLGQGREIKTWDQSPS